MLMICLLEQVAAMLINQPERGFWKNCLVSEDEEIRLVEQFRTDYSPFDFTLS
jgi:hypothetical protein